ncbi:MAG: possible hydrolase [uncultured Corynebacteriales bacterium]|uniref:Possible hydrolase n=1 Tax=uncultured Mycobacteriales bacterium TaxID=581187 RepID=A0A6J4IN56_9ACTN|nr:MAG: possible hydrolase [uncultured Corynebacteriales bacterium]
MSSSAESVPVRTDDPLGGGSLGAVLFDMDGTLVDSEPVWDEALNELARWLGGELSAAARRATVGTNVPVSVRVVHADVDRPDADPELSAAKLVAEAGARFSTGLRWLPGARELLAAVRAAGVPVALVTNTERALVDLALGPLVEELFDVSVCGDEVAHSKPAPDPYLRAARLLGVDPATAVAIEDSPTGTAAAEAAGCPVLVVPTAAVPVPPGPRRTFRTTLAGVTPADLATLTAR